MIANIIPYRILLLTIVSVPQNPVTVEMLTGWSLQCRHWGKHVGHLRCVRAWKAARVVSRVSKGFWTVSYQVLFRLVYVVLMKIRRILLTN